MTHTVKTKSGELTYELVRKRVKNINLRVGTDGTVVVSAGRLVPLSRIERFVAENEAFIVSAKQKAEAHCLSANYEDGATVYLWGSPYRLYVVCGKSGVVVSDGVITLGVTAPEDSIARQRTMRAFYKAECERVIGILCREAMPLFGRTVFPHVTYRRMTSRWGSCQAGANKLSFNISLATVRVEVARYVVFHEFAHFLQQNHSSAFYAELEKRMPAWKQYRAALKKEGRFV